MVREIKGAEKEGTEWNFATEPVKKSRSRKVPEEIGFWASMQPEKKKISLRQKQLHKISFWNIVSELYSVKENFTLILEA